MGYTRVMPRDLFNESKLLKCLGRLSLMIHDGYLPSGWKLEFREYGSENEGFGIDQNPDDGNLYATNLILSYFDREIEVSSIYNSKESYPLLFVGPEGFPITGKVFESDGEFTSEFKALIAILETL